MVYILQQQLVSTSPGTWKSASEDWKEKKACVTEENEQDICEKRSLIESNNNNRELNENGEWRWVIIYGLFYQLGVKKFGIFHSEIYLKKLFKMR